MSEPTPKPADATAAAHPEEKKDEANSAHGDAAAPASGKSKAVHWLKKELPLLIKGSGGYFKEVLLGLISPDWPTRKMSMLFIVSMIGITIVFGMGWQRYRYLKSLQKHVPTHEEIVQRDHAIALEKKAEDERRKHTVVILGTFSVELKRDPNLLQSRTSMHLAELEITVECDTVETCSFVKDSLPAVRNQLTGVFTETDREELITREGKRRIKRVLTDKLNQWLPRGKIENLYITNLILG